MDIEQAERLASLLDGHECTCGGPCGQRVAGYIKEAATVLRAIAAALKSAPAPEASEVTEAMIEAGAAKLAKCIAGVSDGAVAAQVYRAMEAARVG